MKKSIIAIAFLLLCPFYGVRAQERPFFDLSGKGWHLWQDKNAAWQTEDIYLTLEEARKSSCNCSYSGMGYIDFCPDSFGTGSWNS